VDGDLAARLGDRSLFPDLAARAYLNHAAISPPSVAVRRAVEEVLADQARRGVSAHLPWRERREGLRAKLAQLLDADAADIGFVPNTTRGVTDMALCLPWERGDRVVLFDGEFPTNVTPWQRAAELFEVSIAWLPLAPWARDHGEGLAELELELRRGVRLVAISAVQFQSGLRMPLEKMAALCHAHGAELFVDGIQACGGVPLSLRQSGVDYLSSGGHKWLMGLEGTGFLYVRADRVARLRPHVAGWLGHEGGLAFLLEGPGHLRYDRPIKRSVTFVEGGATNVVGYAALEASVDLIASLGVDAIFAHVSAYLDALEPALVERGCRSLRVAEPEGRSCILGVLPPDGVDVIALQKALSARGIATTTPDGVLRFAPHWPNHADEIPLILAALDESLRELR